MSQNSDNKCNFVIDMILAMVWEEPPDLRPMWMLGDLQLQHPEPRNQVQNVLINNSTTIDEKVHYCKKSGKVPTTAKIL